MALLNNPLELVEFFQRTQHGQGLFDTTTEVRMNKKGNPYLGSVKVQTAEVKWGVNYEERVNLIRQIEFKATTFRAEGLKWGTCDDNIVVHHPLNDPYIKTIFLRNIGVPTYWHKGQQIDFSRLMPYMPQYYGSPKQGLDNEVKVRTFMLKNINRVRVGDTVVFEKEEVNG